METPTNDHDLLDEVEVASHSGMSGARISRAILCDGTPVVVKRSSSESDLFQRLLGHPISLDHILWQDGTLGRLPSGVRSAILGTWLSRSGTTIVMADLGESILGGEHSFSADEAVALLERVEQLHRSGLRPSTSTPLKLLISLFDHQGLRDGGATGLAADVQRGWKVFRDIVPHKSAEAIIELKNRPHALVDALMARPSTFCHGDIAAVNMAWAANDLVLVDWGQAFVGPPALEIARFLPSGLVRSELDPDWFLAEYQDISGDRFDAEALSLSLLATLVWYGWRKALDAVETANAELRAKEVASLAWWCDAADRGLRILASAARSRRGVEGQGSRP
ncbi:phosphotransferase [Pseudarthrobacter sp. SL88]|uniref:phosphotransferase family protein n=1 Tax=Pseudarthrobacter sp. SL88 TaxID=2994666 RepID=UPI0022737B4C|nr:phosphotransferase [Pseudarthrobacter sp. SL88]MCY1674990.1 phosphotransferase [Pseudarthrobacter sp. SL88]